MRRPFLGITVLVMAVAALALPASGTAESFRDPFWPVGYKSISSEEPKESKELLDLSRLTPEQQAIIKRHLRVGGILKQGDQRIAIINSDVVREGETLTLTVADQKYRFRIRSLKENNIVIEPVEIAEDT